MKKSWISVYLYYAEPLDGFLISAVYPFVKQVVEKKLASLYFFIRYWENGPHLRLRFLVNSIIKEKIIKTRINNYFKNYFKIHPSVRDDESYPEKIRKKLINNNFLKFVPYIPEYDRYGGITGVQIAEKQFEASSNTVLNIIKQTSVWNYDRAIGAAIEMHAILLYIFHPKITESIKHLEIINQSEQLKKEYEKNFSSQKNTLVTYINNLLLSSKNNNLHTKPWMEKWSKSMIEIHSRLNKAQNKNLLSLPKYRLSPFNIYWPLIASYIHMTNNRLGIKTADEPYIAYLLKCSFESLSKVSK